MSGSIGEAFVGVEEVPVVEEVRMFEDDSGPSATPAPREADVRDEDLADRIAHSNPIGVTKVQFQPEFIPAAPVDPVEVAERVQRAYQDAVGKLKSLDQGIVDTQARVANVERVCGQFYEKIKEARATVPPEPLALDLTELLQEEALGDPAATVKLKKLKAEYNVLSRLAKKKAADVENEVAPTVESLRAMKLLGAKHSRTIASLEAERKAAVIELLRARGEKTGLEYVRLAKELEKTGLEIVALGGFLKRLGSGNAWGDQFDELLLPQLGPATTAIPTVDRFHAPPASHVGIRHASERYVKCSDAEDRLQEALDAEGLHLELPKEEMPQRRPLPTSIVPDVPTAPWTIDRGPDFLTSNYLSGARDAEAPPRPDPNDPRDRPNLGRVVGEL